MQSTKSADLIGHSKFLPWPQLDGCSEILPSTPKRLLRTKIEKWAFLCEGCSLRDFYFRAQKTLRSAWNSESKQTNKKKHKILQSKKVSNTGMKSSLIEQLNDMHIACMGYLYFTPRYGFPKSNGTVPTFCNKIQWWGWHRVLSFNDQVYTYTDKYKWSVGHPFLWLEIYNTSSNLKISENLYESCAMIP